MKKMIIGAAVLAAAAAAVRRFGPAIAQRAMTKCHQMMSKCGEMSGQQAGSPAGMACMSRTTPGPEQAAADDGRRHRIQIGDLAEIEIEDFVPPQNPDGKAYQLANIIHPVNSTQNIATATTSRFSAFGQKFSHPGKYGQSAPFSWAA